MKFIVAILILVEISLIQGNEIEDTMRAELDNYHKECMAVSKVDPQVLKEARAGNVDVNNAALVEHVYCIAKKLNVLKDDKFQLDAVKQHFERQNRGDVFKEIYEKCKSIKKDDIKSYTIKHLKCSYQHAPKDAILI
ncbi:hypothetical protein WA026_018223 [Henosepilachna vigintioctopunctata]|uniref:Uncharacterized protein n=1 Tax=Henosepilachna vigintioctopunctata TaxID=420089 RepID=A0AAW1VI55_9CUCU